MFSAKKDKYVFEYEKNTNIKGQVNLTECHSSNKTYLLCVWRLKMKAKTGRVAGFK